MFNFEKIVPSMELCRKIPEGCFSESPLVWSKYPTFIPDDVGEAIIVPRKFSLVKDVVAPAPTVQEILDQLQERNAFLNSDEIGDCDNLSDFLLGVFLEMKTLE